MTAKAKAVSHGNKVIDYITGEAKSKTHPEMIFRLKDNLMPSHLDASSIWQRMKLATQRFKLIKANVIRIELSPPAEYTKDFTDSDWLRLWDDFVREFDNIELHDKKGRLISGKTNLAGSLYTLWLHKESKGGIPHLHAAVCRVDKSGNVNNDHRIDIRAQRADEIVAMKRGWKTPMDVRKENLYKVAKVCDSIIEKMPKWDLQQYFSMLRQHGYKVFANPDKQGVVHGYSLMVGNARYKASEIGIGRLYTVKNLESLWHVLHPIKVNPLEELNATEQEEGEWDVSKAFDASLIGSLPPQKDDTKEYKPQEDYRAWRSGRVPFSIDLNGDTYKRYIPQSVTNVFDDEFDYRTTANHAELTNLAAAIFVGLLGGNEQAPVGGGGGGNNDLPRRKEDEDDERWARRCATYAKTSIGVKPKQSKGRRR